MKLKDLFEMQLSVDIANYYLDLDAGGHGSDGTTFSVRPDAIVIYQSVDDEEDSKYIIMKNEVSLEMWNDLLDMIKRQGR